MPASAPSVGVEITRADLAAAYLRFEQAWRQRHPAERRLARANQEFDQATLDYFRGANGAAIAAINQLAASLSPRSARGPGRELAESLRVRVTPPTLIRATRQTVSVRLTSLYEIEFPKRQMLALELRLVDRGGARVAGCTMEVEVGKTTLIDLEVPVKSPATGWAVGPYRVELGTGGFAVDGGRFFVVERSPDEVRAANELRLAQVRADTAVLTQALAACRARNALLADAPSGTNSAQFLADPNALMRELEGEIGELLSGRDPYAGRIGDYWRVVQLHQAVQMPVRVFAPAAARRNAALPLLIVLHGVGGDENMFMDGYGAGRVKTLAEERGVLVASPLTYSLLADPRALDRLIEALAFDYRVDLDRVYVLGHSMGAGVAGSLARTKANVVAAACCMAGAVGFGKGAIAPTLVVAGSLDPIAPAGVIARAARSARESRLPVEFRQLEGYGHTLMVGDELPAALEWLLTHRRRQEPASRPVGQAPARTVR